MATDENPFEPLPQNRRARIRARVLRSLDHRPPSFAERARSAMARFGRRCPPRSSSRRFLRSRVERTGD